VRVLFDTSVLVAALIQSHAHHDRSLPWLQRGQNGDITFLVAGHTLAELYSVLTTLPVRPRLSPSLAWRLVHENVETAAEIVTLTDADYLRTVERLAQRGMAGGIIYDALIARAAEKAEAERLLTWNEAHFRRVWPEGEYGVCRFTSAQFWPSPG
jgi:predicted nucleic acid-binding protein